MNALTNTTMFIIATVLALATPTTPTSATTVVTGTDAGIKNVESFRDKPVVSNRDKSGTLSPNNFTQVSQVKKKEAFTDKASTGTERAGIRARLTVKSLY